jgi:choline dehydrogenase-like flavoprotein
MLLDARNSDQVHDTINADVAIVGAGTVGLLLATRLARAGRNIVAIESGGLVSQTSGNAETGESVGKPHEGVLMSRASGLGGTSVLWGGQLAEFDEADLSLPGFEWPVTHGELRRWYDEIYDVFGLRGLRSLEEARLALGQEPDSVQDVERFFTRWLPQPNFAMFFRREIEQLQNLRVIVNAPVSRLEFEGSRLSSVGAGTAGREIHVRANRFVFATGTIPTSRFFLAMQRHAGVPWKDNPHVGRYFQDHLGGKVGDVEILDERRFREFFENAIVDGVKLQPKLRFARAGRARVPSGVSGIFVFRSSVSEHLANVKALVRGLRSGAGFSKLATLPRDLVALNRSFAPLVMRYVQKRRIMAFFDRGVELHVQAEQLPDANSRIRLAEDHPCSDGLPRASVDWQVDGREVTSIQRFVEQASTYLDSRRIARLREQPTTYLEASELLPRLSDTGHQCGGLRMASDPGRGVVDFDSRVWGTSNLYVAGACVFPTSSHANCTLTALAMTLRLSEKLARES